MGRIIDMLAFWRRRHRSHRSTSRTEVSKPRFVPPTNPVTVPPSNPNGVNEVTNTSKPAIIMGLEKETGIDTTISHSQAQTVDNDDDVDAMSDEAYSGNSSGHPSAPPDSDDEEDEATSITKPSLKRRLSVSADASRPSLDQARPMIKRARLAVVVSAQAKVVQLVNVPSMQLGHRNSVMFPSAVWARIAHFVSLDDLWAVNALNHEDPSSSSSAVVANILQAQRTRLQLGLLSHAIRQVVLPSIWNTLVVGSPVMLEQIAQKFEVSSVESALVRQCFIVFEGSKSSSPEESKALPSLLMSLAPTLEHISLHGPTFAAKGLRSVAHCASTFSKLKRVDCCSSESAKGVVSDVEKLIESCKTLQYLHVNTCGLDADADVAHRLSGRHLATSSSSSRSVASLRVLSLVGLSITPHELERLCRSSNHSLKQLVVTLAATPNSCHATTSARRALVSIFGTVGPSLQILDLGESFACPLSQGVGQFDPRSSVRPGIIASSPLAGSGGSVLDEVLIWCSKLVDLRLRACSTLYSTLLLSVLPFTVKRIELGSTVRSATERLGGVTGCGVGWTPGDVENARTGAALFGLESVTVIGGGKEWRKGCDGVERLKKHGIGVHVFS